MKRMLATCVALSAVAVSFAATPTATYMLQQHYVLGGSGKWDYVTLDAAANRLYIARGNRVMVMDTATGKLAGEVAGANGAHRIVIVPGTHLGFVSNGHANSVLPFDLKTLTPQAAIGISGQDPDAMLFDAATASLWTFNGHSNNASVIDPVSRKEKSTVALPGKPEFAVTDDAGHIYVNLEDKSAIAQIDAKAGKVTATWPLAPCDGPTGLAIDTAHHRLFSACANRTLVVLDAVDGHRVAVEAIGDDPDAAGYDAGTATVFSSNADGTLTVIHQGDADHYSVIANVVTAKGARTLAVDTVQHRVYLASPDASGGATPAPQQPFGVLVVGAH